VTCPFPEQAESNPRNLTLVLQVQCHVHHVHAMYIIRTYIQYVTHLMAGHNHTGIDRELTEAAGSYTEDDLRCVCRKASDKKSTNAAGGGKAGLF
jgi:hypothetical protein